MILTNQPKPVCTIMIQRNTKNKNSNQKELYKNERAAPAS